jgi:chromate reductase
MNILLLSGSFHAKSKSLAILKAVQNYFNEHHFSIAEINELPFYSEDLASNKPPQVVKFLQAVENTDAIIICSPEYNHSIPAVLKNAIDWASRPAFQSPLKGKAVTFITQAENAVGGARVQAHLKLVLDSTLSLIYPAHEMMIGNINNVLNEQLEVIDDNTERRLKRHISGFINYATGIEKNK